MPSRSRAAALGDGEVSGYCISVPRPAIATIGPELLPNLKKSFALVQEWPLPDALAFRRGSFFSPKDGCQTLKLVLPKIIT